jgi:long-chain acyl-CoA synthetase
VIPSQLEAAIGRSRFVEQSCVHGENLLHNVVIIAPNWANVEQVVVWSCFCFQIVCLQVLDRLALPPSSSREEMSHNKAVSQLLLDEVTRECKEQKSFSVPVRVIVAAAPFTVENGMATPKMSLRRKNIVHAFQSKISEVKF